MRGQGFGGKVYSVVEVQENYFVSSSPLVSDEEPCFIVAVSQHRGYCFPLLWLGESEEAALIRFRALIFPCYDKASIK